MDASNTNTRRKFLGKMVGATAVASLPLTKISAVAAAERSEHDAWMDEITGTHQCLFDFPQHKRGAGLVHILNYVGTYRDAYGVDVGDISTIGTLYSAGPNSSITMAFNDDMWARYKFGEYHSLDDPKTGKPSVRNLYYKHMDGDELPRIGTIGPFPDASISALQENFGTIFLLCKNAVGALSMDLDRLGLGATSDIMADLSANVMPGVHAIPAMVIAIEKAQAAGISYNKQ